MENQRVRESRESILESGRAGSVQEFGGEKKRSAPTIGGRTTLRRKMKAYSIGGGVEQLAAIFFRIFLHIS